MIARRNGKTDTLNSKSRLQRVSKVPDVLTFGIWPGEPLSDRALGQFYRFTNPSQTR
jgi:hypothetical protein